MKVFLDDIRLPSKIYGNEQDWTLVTTVAETIELLKTGLVTEISLDHDLGTTDPDHTGYDVILWMEENNIWPEYCHVHSANPIAAQKMVAAIQKHLREKE